MHRSSQMGLQAEGSHSAVAPVLTSCLPLGKHHLQLCEALMAVVTPSLCHHPVSCLTSMHGHSQALLPPGPDLFTLWNSALCQ